MSRAVGSRLLILGHHYQQDEVIALADLRGDSYQLSQLAADKRRLPGDRLLRRPLHGRDGRHPGQPARASWPPRGGERVTVVLPDMAAGCSMADMAEIEQVEDCWERAGRGDRHRRRDAGHLRQLGRQPEGLLRPARRHRLHVEQRAGGARLGLCPQAPRAVLSRSAPGPQHGLGDGHPRLERNARLGPARATARAATRPRRFADSRVLLWKGHCSVHQMFRPEHVDQFRAKYPGIKILVHPECTAGSGRPGRRQRLDRQDHPRGRARPAGTKWAIGTEPRMDGPVHAARHRPRAPAQRRPGQRGHVRGARRSARSFRAVACLSASASANRKSPGKRVLDRGSRVLELCRREEETSIARTERKRHYARLVPRLLRAAQQRQPSGVLLAHERRGSEQARHPEANPSPSEAARVTPRGSRTAGRQGIEARKR